MPMFSGRGAQQSGARGRLHRQTDDACVGRLCHGAGGNDATDLPFASQATHHRQPFRPDAAHLLSDPGAHQEHPRSPNVVSTADVKSFAAAP